MSVKFDTGKFPRKCQENPNLVKIGQKYQTFHVLMLPATLNHHKSLSSAEMVSGC
jgi:hypothetical protein